MGKSLDEALLESKMRIDPETRKLAELAALDRKHELESYDNRKTWSDEEITLIFSSKLTDDQLALEIGRKPNAIRQKRHQLRKKMKRLGLK